LRAIKTEQEFRDSIERLREDLPPPVPFEQSGLFRRATIATPYLALADFLMHSGRPELAVSFLDEAESASPYLQGIKLRRAALDEATGDFAGLIESAQAALRETPGDGSLMFKIGQAYYRLGDLAGAEAWLLESAEALPDNPMIWAALNRVHADQERFEQAEADFSKAVSLSPQTATFRSNQARVRARLGREEEAIEGLLAALELDPVNVTILRDLAGLSLRRGARQEALSFIRRGLALEPENPELLQLRQAAER